MKRTKVKESTQRLRRFAFPGRRVAWVLAALCLSGCSQQNVENLKTVLSDSPVANVEESSSELKLVGADKLREEIAKHNGKLVLLSLWAHW